MNARKIMLTLSPLALVASLALAQTAKPAAKPAATMTTSCSTVLKAKVNINAAKLEDMKCLPGFTDSIAKDVIANRPYKDGNQFKLKIEGIGPKLWLKIANYVSFK